MEINNLYYIQVNCICIIMLLFLVTVHFKHNKANTTETMFLKMLVLLTIVYCLSDMTGWLVNGKTFTGARFINYFSGILFVVLPCVFSVIWLQFVYFKIGKDSSAISVPRKIMLYGPIFAIAFLVISTPITGFAFHVDELGNYTRSIGAYLAPIVCYIYMIHAFVCCILYLKKEKNELKREQIIPLCYFVIPIAIAGILQVAFFGITVSQTGFTFSILMVFMNIQYGKISTDELTGLNNRHELRVFLDNVMQNPNTKNFFLIMIDVDYFKSINDNYGHLEGDTALKNVAGILKKVCSLNTYRLFLARYGGDEFVIAGVNRDIEEAELVIEQIQTVTDDANSQLDKPYKLHISAGYSYGSPEEFGSIESIFNSADEAMYSVKQNRKMRIKP